MLFTVSDDERLELFNICAILIKSLIYLLQSLSVRGIVLDCLEESSF